MDDFWLELMCFYKSNKAKINKELCLRSNTNEVMLDFCINPNGELSRSNLCKLALIFSNVLGRRLPDNLHARMILGDSNEAVKEYVYYISKLKPNVMGLFNFNRNNFRSQTLGFCGSTKKLSLR